MAERGSAHDEHDPFVVAALLDSDGAPAERLAGEELVATCADCAALHADLLALSSATADLPTPGRTRDFRLTPADAARLTVTRSGEPVALEARLAGVTTSHTTPAAHAGHDPLLVASLADHSLGDSERAAAGALVAACSACADLHADLLSLRDATRAMPTPTRPRDYALTPDDAARLRRGGWWRLVAAIGSPRDAFSRPLAVGLTTLGLAGLLLASIPSMYQGGATSGILSTVGNRVGDVPQPEAGTDSNGAPIAAPVASAAGAPAAAGKSAVPAAVATAPAPVPADASAAPAPAASAPGQDGFGPLQSAGGAAAPPSAAAFGIKGGQGTPSSVPDVDAGGAATNPSSVPIVLLVSGLFLVTGIGLFAIRWAARRLGDG